MQKIKSPWYGVVWIVIWTAALIWFHQSGMFTTREMAGIFIVWLVMVGITAHLLYRHRLLSRKQARPADTQPAEPSRNAPCPCGSGKKYKRCCGI